MDASDMGADQNLGNNAGQIGKSIGELAVLRTNNTPDKLGGNNDDGNGQNEPYDTVKIESVTRPVKPKVKTRHIVEHHIQKPDNCHKQKDLPPVDGQGASLLNEKAGDPCKRQQENRRHDSSADLVGKNPRKKEDGKRR